jgi:acyl carrier protein
MEEALELVVETLRRLARERILPHDITTMPLTAATAIDDLGVDSVGKLNFISELEERADVPISEGALQGRKTLGDLAAMLVELRK